MQDDPICRGNFTPIDFGDNEDQQCVEVTPLREDSGLREPIVAAKFMVLRMPVDGGFKEIEYIRDHSGDAVMVAARCETGMNAQRTQPTAPQEPLP